MLRLRTDSSDSEEAKLATRTVGCRAITYERQESLRNIADFNFNVEIHCHEPYPTTSLFVNSLWGASAENVYGDLVTISPTIHSNNQQLFVFNKTSINNNYRKRGVRLEKGFFNTLSPAARRLQSSPAAPRRSDVPRPRTAPRKVTNGVSTNGVTAIFMLFDRRFFGYCR